MPDSRSVDPERRNKKVSEHAQDAPDRETEKRMRNVSKNRDAVKKETEPYLRQQYTNSDGEMLCQICKDELPFKLRDDKYYFETVELLPKLNKHHKENYIALCPNHSAMFKYVHDTRGSISEMITELEGNNLDIILSGQDSSIYFTSNHRNDLKTVISTEINSDEN